MPASGYQRILSSVLFLMFISLTSAMANTGKIAGRVTDKATGEPLPGVNVIVEGTNLGAATDINGEYTILNLPPGTYTLRASFIGYSTVRVQNLRVSISRTTRQDFVLAEEVIEGEEVVVVAERPMVQKDLTSSQKITTAEEINELPVLTFSGVVETQSGVNRGPDGQLHIRGGRSDEIGYYIDGVSVSNPFFTNSLAINVSNKALEELRVVSGAFNAEYGNAMSGIINIQIKEGGDKLSGSISAYSGDYISDATDIFPNIDAVDPLARNITEGTLNGPVPFFNNKLTFNVSGRLSNNEGYLYGIREHLPGDSANFRSIDPAEYYWEMNGDSAFVPMNNSQSINLLAKLTYRLTPTMKVSTQLLNTQGTSKSYNHSYKFVPDAIPTRRSNNNNYSIKFNHAFKKSFYEANFFYSTTDFKSYVFEDPEDPRYVSTTKADPPPFTGTFQFGGMSMGHTYRKSESIGLKADYTNQINARHEFKTGINYRRDNLRERNFIVLYDNFLYPRPTVLGENESPAHTYYDKQATFFSAYAQDKIEYNDMIINAGLRYDYFNPNAQYFKNLLKPDSEDPADFAQAEPKINWSPRLGVAFPITDRGILHFSYGHFYQMPQLRRLYRANLFGAGQTPTVGYANLKPQKTVNYEFGLQQQFTDVIALEATVFYKDIRDLLALQTIRYESEKFGPSTYNVYLNKDYGTVKGFTMSLTKRYDPASKLSANVDYTYQQARGNDVRSGAFFFSAISGIVEEKRIVPLNWDQTHLLNTTVSLSDPGNWGLSLIAKISSGWPYTPYIPDANYIPRANSGRKPWQQTVDVRFFKNIHVSGYDFVFFLQVFNLFDRRNERFVFDDTGRAGYTFANRETQETELFRSFYGQPGIHTWSEFQVRPQYYSPPRMVQAGLTLEF